MYVYDDWWTISSMLGLWWYKGSRFQFNGLESLVKAPGRIVNCCKQCKTNSQNLQRNFFRTFDAIVTIGLVGYSLQARLVGYTLLVGLVGYTLSVGLVGYSLYWQATHCIGMLLTVLTGYSLYWQATHCIGRPTLFSQQVILLLTRSICVSLLI